MSVRLPVAPLPIRRLRRDVRRVVARHPWIYWFAVGALAAWAYGAARSRSDAAADARAAWGAVTPVLVATAELRPGDPLAGHVELVSWPAAVAPPDALAEAAPAAVARQHVAVGAPLGVADVAPAGGPLGLAPEGWLAAPVIEQPRSGAVAGDRVQVVSDGVVLAAEAIVVGFVEEASEPVTLVAAPAEVAALLPAAGAAGRLTLLRVP